MLHCKLCGNETKKIALNFGRSFLRGITKHSLYQCKNCGIVFTHPIINTAVSLGEIGNCKLSRNYLLNFIRYYTVYRWILKFSFPRRIILDFGCGKGEFVFYLRQKGWQAYGVDPKLRTIVKVPLNKNLFSLSLTHLQSNLKGYFDAIILNFSLEHCENPALTLEELHSLITLKGFIFIRVPNLNYILRNKKFAAFQLRIPFHRYFFTPESLTDLLEKSGFRIFSIDTPFCLTSAITPPCSILPQLDPLAWLYEKRISIKLKKAVLLGILSLVFLPFVLFKSQNKQGPIIYAVAQKI